MTLAYAGLDVSPTHSGLVVLDEAGRLLRFYFIGKTQKECKLPKNASGEGLCYPSELTGSKMPDAGQRSVYRLGWMRSWFGDVMSRVLKDHDPIHLAIEDYAFGAGQGAHQIGEVGGMIRLHLLYETSVCFRLHDPKTVKLYMTGRGDADKSVVRDAVREATGVDFESYGISTKTAEDLYDSYALALLVRDEVLLRAGKITLRDLPEARVRVFNRVTRANPTNILAREWLVGLADDAL